MNNDILRRCMDSPDPFKKLEQELRLENIRRQLAEIEDLRNRNKNKKGKRFYTRKRKSR